MMLTDALSTCEQALHNPTDWMPACQQLANILQGVGQFEESSEWLSLSLEPEPDAVSVYARLGRLYARQESWPQAIEAFQQILNLPRGHAGAYWHLAKIYEHLEQVEKEFDCRYQLFALRPDEASGEGYYQLGDWFVEQEKPEEAITCYLHCIEYDAHFWAAYYKLGDLFSAQGECEQAIAIYQSVLDQDPYQMKAHFQMGMVWVKHQDDELAISKFREIVSLNPEFPWAYLELIKILIKQERWDDAIATCEAVIEFVQEYPWVYSHMGQALLNKGEVAEATACYQKACVMRGWWQCQENGYQFTQDSFSFQIELWLKHLQPLAEKAGVQALEVGSFEGMTTCWLVDHVFTEPEDHVTCVAPQFLKTFASNLERAEADHRVTLLEGPVHAYLETLEAETYDLINIQDRCKEAEHLYLDATLAWKGLKAGGMLLFKDYGWRGAKDPRQAPKVGIDNFLRSVKGQFKILHQGYQLILQKGEG